MGYSIKAIQDSLPKKKSSVSSFWVKLFVRRLSFLFTYILINLGFSANAVSLISGIVALAGCIFLSIDNTFLMIAGVVLINFWIVLDCVDGNIARVEKKDSYMGEFFDAISGYVICGFSLLAIGIAAYNRSTILLGPNNIYIIIIGAIGSITNLFARLIYQKYSNSCTMTEGKVMGSSKYVPENYSFYDPNARKGLTYLRLVVDRQLGISGLFMPFLIVSSIFDWYDFMVIFYSLYYTASLIATYVIFSKKAIIFEEELKKKNGKV